MLQLRITEYPTSFCLGVPPSSFTQVVHSAGRRFIVSPVPESRLKEQGFFTSAIPGAKETPDMGKLPNLLNCEG